MDDENDNQVSEKTADRYKKTAEHFYGKYLGDTSPTPKKIADALVKAAPDYTVGSWMALRSALIYDQKKKKFAEAAKRIKDTKFPADVKRKRGQGRAKKVVQADLDRLLDEIERRNEAGVFGSVAELGAIILAMKLGCRPNEMPGVVVQDDGTVFVPGSKFREDGLRGLDRVISVDEDDLDHIRAAITYLAAEPDHPSGKMHVIQSRIYRISKKLFPEREKGRPNLYAFRHQLGADLKADKKRSRFEIAYIMGHQATASVDKYGDPRNGRRTHSIKPGVTPEQVEDIVRETHSKPFGPKPAKKQKNPPPAPAANVDDDPFVPKKPSGPKM